MTTLRNTAGAMGAPIAVEGPYGTVRLKWHKLRTGYKEAPFRRTNLTLGWRLGASLEIDILACGDGRFAVLHDLTLGPSTTGRGHATRLSIEAMAGFLHRDRAGRPDPDAPVTSLAALVAPLGDLPRAPGASLQLDLKVPAGRPLPERAVGDAAAAVAGISDAIIIGAHHLDQARRLADAIPGARLGYDPMEAVARQPRLAEPAALLRHLEKRVSGISLVYLRFDVIVKAAARGFPLVERLLDLGIETDAWTLNPGPALTDAVLRALIEARVRQITTDSPGEIASRIAAIYPA